MSRSLEAIRKSGRLRVAVSREIKGFSYTDDQGARAGIDVDLAHALSHALLGSADGIEFVEISPGSRLAVVASGVVDIGLFNLSASLERIHSTGLLPMVPYFYDEEAALIGSGRGAVSLRDLTSPVIAVQEGSTSADNLERYLGDRCYSIIECDTHERAMDVYENSVADAYVLDACSLHLAREELSRPCDHHVTRDPISTESLIAAIKIESLDLGIAFHAVLKGLLAAEDLAGKHDQNSRADAPAELASKSVEIDGVTLLSEGYISRALEAVGDFREIYERNFKLSNGELIPRANNSLVKDGGLHVPVPIH